MNKLEILKNKIVAQKELAPILSYWNFLDKKIVFTNGCFDIIHKGHIEYLAKAANLGDILIVGLNSDKSVKRLKGEKRPYQDETSRAMVLASLHFINAVVLFEEDTPYELIKLIQPEILVKGGDYKSKEIVGQDIVEAKGGSVVTIDFVEGYSTSKIIKSILE